MIKNPVIYCKRCKCSGVTVLCCLRRQIKARAKKIINQPYPECIDCEQGKKLAIKYPELVKAATKPPEKKQDYKAMHERKKAGRADLKKRIADLRGATLSIMEALGHAD